jgi:hypothetical protein
MPAQSSRRALKPSTNEITMDHCRRLYPHEPSFHASVGLFASLALLASGSACNRSEGPGSAGSDLRSPFDSYQTTADAGTGGTTVAVGGGLDAFSATPPTICVEPEEPLTPPAYLTSRVAPEPLPPVPGSLVDGGNTLLFHPRGTGTVTIRSALVEPGDCSTSVEVERGSRRLTVVASTDGRTPSGFTTSTRDADSVLIAPTADLSEYEIATTYRVISSRELAIDDITLVHASTGAAVGHAAGAGHITAVPGSCEEQAVVRFGLIPVGMPSFKWPTNEGCDDTRCVDTRLAYMQAVHATWRMVQMMDIVASYPEVSRSWAWGRPAVDEHGDSAGNRTRPRHVFGPYSSERFGVIRELYQEHLVVLRQARMDGIDLRLKCPEANEQSGNWCFTTGTLAHHVAKGWVNVCPETWDRLDDDFASDAEGRAAWFDHIVGHELYHHHYVNIPGVGWKMVKDFEYMYAYWDFSPFDTNLTHLADYVNGQGESCGHRNVALRNVDTYNTIARIIGRGVWKRDIWSWPMPAEPTPHAPACVGDIGCLCEDVDTGGYNTPPDGDFQEDTYCVDLDGQVECMTTTFNASETVGICTRCEDTRGPGCPCRDGHTPCDVGTCWGDDTGGTNSSWGQCFVDPPHFACLADCEELLGPGAFCLTDHPDHARCVPVATGLPEASNCWWDEGHMDPQTLACTSTPECGPGAPPLPGYDTPPTCQDLRYPPYFVCDASQRCVLDL